MRRWLLSVTGGSAVFPLAILFGLNAVDELDRAAFGVLLPEIRDEYGLGLQGTLTLIAIVSGVALALQIPIAVWSDRHSRVKLTVAGAIAWGIFSLLTGLATSIVMLAIVRCGSSIGKAVVDPTHNSLIADYYPVGVRPRVYSVHRAANAVGSFVGPLFAGILAYEFGWRTPFFIFAIPTIILVFFALRLREPVRGAQERRAMGADEATVETAEEPPSFAEGWRMVWKIESLRRIWVALPFLAASLVGFVSLAGLMYEQVFDLDERARGIVAAGVEPLQLVGLIYGARFGMKMLAKGPGKILDFLAWVALGTSALSVAFALAPTIWFAVIVNALIAASLAALAPGLLASLSLAIPPRARSLGFSVASLWVLPGLLILPVIGWIGDRFGIRYGMLLMVPVFFIGGLLVSRAGKVMDADVAQVWRTTAARSEVAYLRKQGQVKFLLVRGLDVFYGSNQVLFDVNLDVAEGECVALLGTNGAGKSTLLKAISGAIVPNRGAVIVDGRETTFAPSYELAARGIAQLPGGAGVFTSLTVKENLELAGWLYRRQHDDIAARTERVLEMFPVLRERGGSTAADLSGGQQQMLALAMVFISRPRLLMIDELSLGLAPIVLAQLIPVVEELRAGGTTVILVEQSVNLALTLASRAFFMEKGEIKYEGPTDALLERPDILRSVFLGTAIDAVAAAPAPSAPARDDSAPALEVHGVTRAFAGVTALDDVTFTIAPGEIVGIIGPNGAGKTTLFDVISGFTKPDDGRVLLGAADVTGLPPHRRALAGLGRTFQDSSLFAGLTVEEVLGVALRRETEIRDPLSAALYRPALFESEQHVARRVEELLELFGLANFRTRFVRELSTGSRRIVDLACVVAHRPTVVLLDEPSSGIAQREAEALGPLLVRIRDGLGASLLVIEHDMPLVSAVSERLLAMDQGRVIADDTPARVLGDADVVRAYLGDDERLIARSHFAT